MKTSSDLYVLLLIIASVALMALLATFHRESTFFVMVIRICAPMALLSSLYLLYDKIKQ